MHARYPRAVPTPPHVPAAARRAILAWYSEHGRPLAFRRTRDPWAILVSETMAQQTQAARAADHWQRFMARYPTVEALAAASPGDVLRAWQGLGYDRRALALQRAARVIVADHGGTVPESVEVLETLPGVGPYTARAVAALGYGVRVGAVDVNVRRVIGRLVAGRPDGLPTRELQVVADDAVPRDRPGDWTHAVMDLGATVCRARSPDCPACPVRRWCKAVQDADPASVGVAGARRTSVDPTRPRRRTIPFPATTRWLRGRILDRLRAADDGSWVAFDGPIGGHAAPDVGIALGRMARDGVVELAAPDDGAPRARLPLI